MPQLQLEKPKPKHKNKVDTPKRKAALQEVVLNNLGTPDDLVKVHVKKLWNADFYRINVYRKIKDKTLITDSFFVQCCQGTPYFSPPIEFKYHDGELAKMFAGLPHSLSITK